MAWDWDFGQVTVWSSLHGIVSYPCFIGQCCFLVVRANVPLLVTTKLVDRGRIVYNYGLQNKTCIALYIYKKIFLSYSNDKEDP